MSNSKTDLQWVERLAKTMTDHKLHKLEVETEDVSLTLKAKPVVPKLEPVAPAVTAAGEAPDMDEADVTLIRSQNVGLFRPADTLKPGSEVSVGQKIGIVEAVSVEHDLVSAYTGQLLEMLVQDGDPVEYGQPLLVLSESEG